MTSPLRAPCRAVPPRAVHDHTGEPTAAAWQIIARDAIPCGTARAGMCAQTSRHVRPVPGFRNAQRAGFACIDRTVRPCAVRSGAARCQRGAPPCLVCIASFARILALLAPKMLFPCFKSNHMKFFEGPRELINFLFFSGGNIFLKMH